MKAKDNDKKMTLDKLAQMIGGGFAVMDKRFDQTQTDIGGMKTDIGGMKSDILTLQLDVNGMKSDIVCIKSDIGEIKARLDSIEADIVLIKKQLDNIIYRHEFEALKGRIADVEKRLSKMHVVK